MYQHTLEGRTPLLVAHNGNVFDFRVIKRVCVRQQLQLPPNVWVLDSYALVKHAKHRLPASQKLAQV